MTMKTQLLMSMMLFGSLVTADTVNIIPKPTEVQTKTGVFELNNSTTILYSEGSQMQAQQLNDYLKPATGYDLKIMRASRSSGNTILLKMDVDLANVGEEGYTLDVGKDRIVITAKTDAGLFYGIQTLRQLSPTEIYSGSKAAVGWQIPCVQIKDSPTYPWRGMMLDVSRYFFEKEYVIRYMEMMAMHKLNVLHLHIVDDPGWRIEIDKYPKLTEIGGFRGKGVKKYGGYYTKEDIREIVEHANRLQIEIVPEIELPAHCQSALAAYPWLGCTQQQLEVPTTCYISREILCAGRESTYKFLEEVMTEVIDMFPGRFIHVGGDEAKYDRWKQCPDCKKKMQDENLKEYKHLQGYMTRRIEKFLMTKNRRLIGWDEILDGGLAPNATVMTWHRPKTAVEAAKSGNNVVMALTGHAYFDTPESKLPGEPPAATWLPPISLQKAYEWEPVPASLSADEKKFILGAHGCLWTDRFMHNPILQDLATMDENRSFQYVDYLSLPRMSALAEVTWTPQKMRSWEDFANRQAIQYNRYTAGKYHFRVPQPVVQKPVKMTDGYKISMASPVNGAQLRYTTDGSYPTVRSALYTQPISVDNPQDFSAITVVNKRHASLAFKFPEDKNKRFAKYGVKIGEWKSGKVSAGTYKPVKFDATGKINKNGTYEVTFLYTGGEQRLDIEKVEVIVNGKVVARDVHQGTTGGQNKDNTYTLKITNYETGANYTIQANVMGDTGNDSNGVVMLKAVQ